MPPVACWPSIRSSFAAACLGLILGCQSEDADFHSYQESTPTQPSVTTAIQPSDSGVIPASAETIKPLPSEITAPPSQPTVATDSASDPTGPVSIGSAVPTPPVVPAEPPVDVQASPPELALSIPPAPPVAVSLASLNTAAASPALLNRKMELLIPEKTFDVEGPEGAVRVSFDDIDLLKVLNVEPVPIDVEEHLPAWLSGLDGKMVRIRGWMYPPPLDSGLRGFLFVRDNQICCFGRLPKVYDKFGVRLRDGETTDYIQGRPFDVVGRMKVKSRIEDGELFWLYLIEDAIVIDK